MKIKSSLFRIRQFKPISRTNAGRIYIFCGLGSPLAYYLPAITRFRKHGFSVVIFKFKTRAILDLSIVNFSEVIKEVVTTVSALEKANESAKTVVAIGNSMGSVFAWHVAAKVPSITKVVANTGYALISKHIFEDRIGLHWRKKLIADGLDEHEFHKQILDSEPTSVMPRVHGKQILIFLNKDDNVISFSNSILYKKVLDEHNIPFEYVENSKIRHGTAIMKNLLSKRLLEFIEQ